jgi:hypothetical protein
VRLLHEVQKTGVSLLCSDEKLDQACHDAAAVCVGLLSALQDLPLHLVAVGLAVKHLSNQRHNPVDVVARVDHVD